MTSKGSLTRPVSLLAITSGNTATPTQDKWKPPSPKRLLGTWEPKKNRASLGRYSRAWRGAATGRDLAENQGFRGENGLEFEGF